MVSSDILREYPFFAGLSEEELRSVAEITQEKTYEPNTYIGYEGKPAEKLYMVVLGHVEIQINTDADGLERETVVVRHAGEICGWSALVKPYILTASLFCPVRVTVLEIDAGALREMFERDHHLGYIMLQKVAAVASERLRDTRLQLLGRAAQQPATV
jgi:CRP/FNR family cyclic AMP-dependent transcriptional regulator